MKIKDLPEDTNLGGVKVKTDSGQIGYWKSQWNKGVWLTKEFGDAKVFPVYVDDLKYCLEWEVLEEK